MIYCVGQELIRVIAVIFRECFKLFRAMLSDAQHDFARLSIFHIQRGVRGSIRLREELRFLWTLRHAREHIFDMLACAKHVGLEVQTRAKVRSRLPASQSNFVYASAL